MTDDAAFLQSITAATADDLPRLVYADWLEEHGRPDEADYLRAEVELAKIPPAAAAESGPARSRLRRAWASVAPAWLAVMTQPRVLRANPTPFPALWINFDLGTVRPGSNTYDSWPYESLPDLSTDDLRGDFAFLGVAARAGGAVRPEFAKVVAHAAGFGVRLPDSFVSFMTNVETAGSFHSVTDCYFRTANKHNPVRTGTDGEGVHVHFYCDSQSCVLWDLYVWPGGGHCVIARDFDYFDPEPRDEDEDEDREAPRRDGPGAWFVAPSFEAFVYRVWLENQVWYAAHSNFVGGLRGQPESFQAVQDSQHHYRDRA